MSDMDGGLPRVNVRTLVKRREFESTSQFEQLLVRSRLSELAISAGCVELIVRMF